MLTDDEKFVGLRQQDDDLDTLLETYVDDERRRGRHGDRGQPARLASGRSGRTPAATTRTSASVGDDEVLVYGSAPTEDLLDDRAVADRRTLE